MTRVLIVQGHPDPDGAHFCNALADNYAEGARAGGHEVRQIQVAALNLPLLRDPHAWRGEVPADAVRKCQEEIGWAEHIVFFYPLWLGGMPAVLKGFLEQVMRPPFALDETADSWPRGKLGGRSARIVVSMGMPALIYRWYFGAHSLKSLERNILRLVGIRPIRESLIGMVEAGGAARREKWLRAMRELGRKAR